MGDSDKEKKGSEKTRGNPLASREEKLKVLEAARLQIEKQFGAGAIIKMGDTSLSAGIEVIPSGSILLDEALGIGGYPRGRIVEIYGPESSGKTTLALHAVAEAQRRGGIAAFVDAEHALDPVYAKNLGVNIEELWIAQPDSGEQALEITENLVRSGAMDVIVVDSVAALTPQAEIDGDMGDAQMGLQARLMSQAMRKLTAIIGKSRTLLIFINQIRMKIGIMFGNPETTTGGNALKFYSSVRLDVRKTETIEGGKDADAVGNRIKVKVAKNKVAPPFRRVELEIIFGKGVSAIGSLLDAAVKHEIIDKKGAWYAYGEEKVGQGRENAKEYLVQNPAFADEIEKKLRKIMFPGREFPDAPPRPAAPSQEAAPVAAQKEGSVVEESSVKMEGKQPEPQTGESEAEKKETGESIAPVSVDAEAAVASSEEGIPEKPVSVEPEPALQRGILRRFDPEEGVNTLVSDKGPGRPPSSSRSPTEPVNRGPGRPAGTVAARPVPETPPSRGPGRPPAGTTGPGTSAAPVTRGPGRPPASSRPPSEPASRGPGRPRKVPGDDF